jgi:hypothetical protein
MPRQKTPQLYYHYYLSITHDLIIFSMVVCILSFFHDFCLGINAVKLPLHRGTASTLVYATQWGQNFSEVAFPKFQHNQILYILRRQQKFGSLKKFGDFTKYFWLSLYFNPESLEKLS